LPFNSEATNMVNQSPDQLALSHGARDLGSASQRPQTF
jgi:hypothetical protein